MQSQAEATHVRVGYPHTALKVQLLLVRPEHLGRDADDRHEAVRAAHDDAFAVAQWTHAQQPAHSFVHCSERLHQLGIHNKLQVAVFKKTDKNIVGLSRVDGRRS
jgi:hypothetical protein